MTVKFKDNEHSFTVYNVASIFQELCIIRKPIYLKPLTGSRLIVCCDNDAGIEVESVETETSNILLITID